MTNWFEHPAALGSFRAWMRLVARADRIDREFWPRVAAVGLTTLATSPLRAVERLRFGRAIDATRVDPSPVFVLGHWRTGTTHLLNLLAQDPRFGCISTFQAMVPGFVLGTERRVKPWLARQLGTSHPTREIDNMPLDLDAPQEEAFALANLTPWASLHAFTLPHQAREWIERYGFLCGLSALERREWTAAYLRLLRTATLRCGGKRLVLKDPTNTGRIPALLELFPDARFVHIVRDPYRVLPSTLGIYRVVLAKSQLQRASEGEIEEAVLAVFERMMRKYLEDRTLIPAGNLAETRYEDLEARPMGEMARIYGELGLDGFETAAPAIEAYLASLGSFRKNQYRVDASVVAKVNGRWEFALDAWRYPRLGGST